MTGVRTRGRITGGRVLVPDGTVRIGGDLAWTGSTITTVGSPVDEATDPVRADRGDEGSHRAGSGADLTIDATGCWVLPGIVDLHGDAFERCLMPRPRVMADAEAALDENETHLLAAGITTSYLSATDSWEPGLRSRDTLRHLVAALARRRSDGPDVRLHVRHERCATAGHDELAGWIGDGTVGLLSFNDHTPAEGRSPADVSTTQVDRSGIDRHTLAGLQARAVADRPTGLTQERELALVAAAAECPTASHDASGPDDLARDRALGVRIAEFPTTIDLALRYREAGMEPLFGAPNLVRGSSHLGNLSVREAVEADAGGILCSDYHYPALLRAPFVLDHHDILPLTEAWSLVSTNPAAGAGLDDRGRLEPGARADVVVVEPGGEDGTKPRVRAVVCDGVVALHRP